MSRGTEKSYNAMRTNIRLYSSKSLTACSWVDESLSIPMITTYGPDVHGNRNKLTKNPMPKAPGIEVTLEVIFFNLGRQDSGTSILNHRPYHK
jgi:hypothetical protein